MNIKICCAICGKSLKYVSFINRSEDLVLEVIESHKCDDESLKFWRKETGRDW